jgi:hypothetical protein
MVLLGAFCCTTTGYFIFNPPYFRDHVCLCNCRFNHCLVEFCVDNINYELKFCVFKFVSTKDTGCLPAGKASNLSNWSSFNRLGSSLDDRSKVSKDRIFWNQVYHAPVQKKLLPATWQKSSPRPWSASDASETSKQKLHFMGMQVPQLVVLRGVWQIEFLLGLARVN